MGRLGRQLRKLTKSPGMPQARHLAERSVAPYLRSDLHQLGLDHGLTVERLSDLERKVDRLEQLLTLLHASVQALDLHQPAVLNAIASTNGTARLLTRETDWLRSLTNQLSETIAKGSDQMSDEMAQMSNKFAQVSDEIAQVSGQMSDKLTQVSDTATRRLDAIVPALHAGDEAVRQEIRPHIQTLAWLLQRVETVRAEMMHELRYGAAKSDDATATIETKIVNPAALDVSELRVNLGAGHIAIEGFVNVDMRELPGIDVVAAIDSLPFEPGSLTEIFSSHTVEHFPELQLRRKLLPYWVSLLKPGGMFRAIVPDLEAMTKAYAEGDISFEVLRSVIYGGQEYEGDFHFTGFTPTSLGALLVECGLEAPNVIAQGRPNGDCLEFEISATKPSG